MDMKNRRSWREWRRSEERRGEERRGGVQGGRGASETLNWHFPPSSSLLFAVIEASACPWAWLWWVYLTSACLE